MIVSAAAVAGASVARAKVLPAANLRLEATPAIRRIMPLSQKLRCYAYDIDVYSNITKSKYDLFSN